MAYQPISFAGFGSGLNLRDKVDAVSETECIDALNVEFTTRGAVRQRDGYEVFTDVELDGQGDTLHPHYESDGTKHLIVGDTATGQLTALNTSGVEVDIEAVLSNGGCFGFQRFGAPGNEYTYIGNGVDELWYYNGTAFTNVPDDTGARIPPKGGALALSPGEGGNTSNRLVNARFTTTTGGPGAATTTPSTIWFSDPGDPVVWGANNFLHLDPGDGESIQDIVNWGGQLFVFKETKFYVFYGESVSSSGDPIFNYKTENTGHGACGPRAVSTDETGVYFFDRAGGLMRTTGGPPEHLSDIISPIIEGNASDYFLGGELSHAAIAKVAVNAHDERVYVNYSNGGSTNDRTLVFDPHDNWWSLWDVAAADMTSWRQSNQARLFFTYPAGTNDVAYVDPTFTNDGAIDTATRAGNTAGSAITSRWRSGWFDYEQPIVKTIRESKVWGSGKVQLGVGYDFRQNPGSLSLLDFTDPTQDTWGGTTWGGGTWAEPAGLLAQVRRRAVRGTVFSTYLTNATLDTTFAVHRLEHHLRESRVPSVKAA